MYEKFLTKKSIFFNTQTGILLLTFAIVRILSFALTEHLIIQAIIVFVILMIFGILYYKNPDFAFYLLLGEFFLGGSGHFFELMGLSIRTVLLTSFIILWITHSLGSNKKYRLRIPHPIFYMLLTLAGYIILSALIGINNGHGIKAVVQDLLPYGFFLLLLPACHLFKNKEGVEYVIRLLTVFIIGSAVFSLITFILFSSGNEALHGSFYKWFRDVAMGKITYAGNGFFRIVVPGHLLVTPTALFISSLLMRKERHHILWYVLLITSILILVLNLSRTYMLALLGGLLIQKYKHTWKQWGKIFIITCMTGVLLFTGISIISSGGKSAGWNLFGSRIAGIAEPSTETSARTRMSLLNPIFKQIKLSPIFGSGIGAALTFTNPETNNFETTRQFDWGYFEMLAELGLVGSLIFLSIILYTFYLLIKKIQAVYDYHDFYVGLLAGLFSFLVMNITAPTLFHVYGVFYIMLVITITSKHETLLNQAVSLLYRVFRKLKV